MQKIKERRGNIKRYEEVPKWVTDKRKDVKDLVVYWRHTADGYFDAVNEDRKKV